MLSLSLSIRKLLTKMPPPVPLPPPPPPPPSFKAIGLSLFLIDQIIDKNKN